MVFVRQLSKGSNSSLGKLLQTNFRNNFGIWFLALKLLDYLSSNMIKKVEKPTFFHTCLFPGFFSTLKGTLKDEVTSVKWGGTPSRKSFFHGVKSTRLGNRGLFLKVGAVVFERILKLGADLLNNAEMLLFTQDILYFTL